MASYIRAVHVGGILALVVSTNAWSINAASNLSDQTQRNLGSGIPQEVLVVYGDAKYDDVENRIRALNADKQQRQIVKQQLKNEIQRLQAGSLDASNKKGLKKIRGFHNFPISLVRVDDLAGLAALESDKSVRGIFENGTYRQALPQSLPLIRQTVAQNHGYQGQGKSVAIIDSGINFYNPVFGCTGVGVPASCSVVANVDCSRSSVAGCREIPSTTYAGNHGTHMGAIVKGVAPAVKLLSINVFIGDIAGDVDIIAALDWVADNSYRFPDVVAANLSLGDEVPYQTGCHSTAMGRAMSLVGIETVAAAGNDGFTNGVSSPACAADFAVGAVYDDNLGSKFWQGAACTDPVTGPDMVACYSNSSYMVNLLAPGCSISAAGLTYCGTSQAAPQVAAALAILAQAYPDDSNVDTRRRIIDTGVLIRDSKSIETTPRIDIGAALDEAINPRPPPEEPPPSEPPPSEPPPSEPPQQDFSWLVPVVTYLLGQ